MKARVFLSNGNAYAVLGVCSKAAADAGWLHREWRDFARRARAGTYEELMEHVRIAFEVELGRGFSERPEDWRNYEALPEEE